MLITLSCRIAICKSVEEPLLTSVDPLGAVSHRFIVFFFNLDFSRPFVSGLTTLPIDKYSRLLLDLPWDFSLVENYLMVRKD